MTIDHHLGHAVRALTRSPRYTWSVVVTSGLGIGALAVAFTFTNAFVWRPMPFVDAHELVGISTTHASASGEVVDFAVSPRDYLEFAARQRTLRGLAAINSQGYAVMVTAGAEPQGVRGAAVSASMWTLLGTRAHIGRVFDESEDRADNPVVVISDMLARRYFPEDPASAVGRTLIVEGVTRTIIGVMPPGYRPRMNPGDLWVPLGVVPGVPGANTSRQLQVVGRLQPGVTLAQARDDLDRIALELAAEFPATNRDWGASVKDLRAKIGDSARGVVVALLAAVAFLLLLTCANVANLAMARLNRRRPDLATRLALGAAPGGLARGLVGEAVVLAVAGSLVGLLLALGAIPVTLRLLTSDNPLLSLVAFDWRVVAVAGGTGLLSGSLAAAVPSVLGMRRIARAPFTAGSRRASAGVADTRIRRTLMTVQVAAASVLLVGSLAAVGALRGLHRVGVGYEPSRLTVGSMRLSPVSYPRPADRAAFVREVLRELGSVPGLERVGVTTASFLRDNKVQSVMTLEGDAGPAPAELVAEIRRTGGDYFQVMGIGLVAGRHFTPADRDSTPLVAIVNQSFVRQYLGAREPLGVRIRRGANVWTIVGVVPDVRDGGQGEDLGAMLYAPYAQNPSTLVTFVVASRLGPAEVTRALKAAVGAVNASQPFERIAPARQLLRESLGEERFKTLVLAVLAGLAVLVACVGIFSVTAYLVEGSTREIAIRLALGAVRADVIGAFVRDSGRWIAGGALAGALLARLGGAWLGDRLPEVAALAPWQYLATAALLLATGLVATVIPTARAGTAEPAEVLRRD